MCSTSAESFRLLAKGPRLDGYLAQLKKADKLDFASWGGFAQNFAGRRIPFEHPSSIPFWEQARARESVHPDLRRRRPAALMCPRRRSKARSNRRGFRSLDRNHHERRLRRALAEDRAASQSRGESRRCRARRRGKQPHAPASRRPIPRRSPTPGMKVYLLRVSTLIARGAGKFELGWKSLRGNRRRPPDRRKHADFRRNGRARDRFRGIVAGTFGLRSGQTVPGL